MTRYEPRSNKCYSPSDHRIPYSTSLGCIEFRQTEARVRVESQRRVYISLRRREAKTVPSVG